MDWNEMRDRWRAEPAKTPMAEMLARIGARSGRLRKAVLRRDVVETVVAIVMIPPFAWLAWQLGARGQWLPFAFIAFLLGWLVYVPLRLRRARLALPRHRADLPTRDYLAAEREGMIAQAGMLEAVWRWYLAPCAIGVVGFVVSARGITPKTLGYAAVVVGFCVLLHVANRAAARHFRTLADDIREQVAAFERSNEP